MLTVVAPCDQALADAALGWLRDAWTRYAHHEDVFSGADAVNAEWTKRLAPVAAAPVWRPLGSVEHLSHPLTLFAGTFPAHPDLLVLAAALAGVDGYSVSLASARACPAGGGRYEVTLLTSGPASLLAKALSDSVLGADINHDCCQPAHPRHEAAELRRH